MITAQSTKKTKLAIALSAVLKEPFTCLYILLPYFLLKDVGATALHIAILTTLRPVSSFFAFYYSELVSRNALTLRSAMLVSGILARLAFVPAVLTNSASLYIVGSVMYMIFSRAEVPAFMEVIKKNVDKSLWEKSFSLGSVISYSSGVVWTYLFASYLDLTPEGWKTLFTISLLLGCLAVMIVAYLIENDQPVRSISKSIRGGIVSPIQDAVALMKENASFRKFQWSFMIGGLGLMIIQPVIPVYFSNVLKLSYSDLMIAFCVCKAIGFVCTTPLWNTILKKISPGAFILFVLLGFALFSFALAFSYLSIRSIFIAYIIFGVAQAGSHLIWHLSGPIFSGEDSSSRYSGVNIVMVGVRGIVGPSFGYLLLFYLHPIAIFFVSMALCLGGALYYVRASSVVSDVA